MGDGSYISSGNNLIFRKAWEKGYARAVYALASSNYHDEFNPDYEEAYFCFSALSEVNQLDAHFFLADMCMRGKGVKKDYVEAYKHLILAGITENEEEINQMILESIN